VAALHNTLGLVRTLIALVATCLVGVVSGWPGAARAGTPTPAPPAESGAAAKAESLGPPAVVVEMTDRVRFEPAEVKINVGDVVQWKGVSALVHTVTDVPSLATMEGSAQLPPGAAPFNSGDLQPGASFLHRFMVTGTYRYFCIPHEAARMVGTVVVAPAGASVGSGRTDAPRAVAPKAGPASASSG